MKSLHIDLKNCYGIGEMKADIKFGSGKNACVIYAPNGTMKTSFTNTVLNLIAGKQLIISRTLQISLNLQQS